MGKVETGQCVRLSIFSLAKHEYFLDGYKSYRSTTLYFVNNFTGRESHIGAVISLMVGYECLILFYAATLDTGETIDVESKFPLTTTFCNLGGYRYWFICSHETDGKPCGRRVGVLYMKGHEFACRHCHDLTYNSRKLSGRYKAAGNIISIRALEAAENAAKRMYYGGKITRKYYRYLRIEAKFRHNWAMNLFTIYDMKEGRDARLLEKALNMTDA
ncbi:MAG: hypothetical protein HYR90_04135 [Candidatus Andersenbacteria bacterium]|nr:hypothetical protein [Candidatus Andersenbacteria bacterium]MBI3250809.1 hypothetical protein [Candidatus Andersenbacteria bacterium]